MTSGKGGLYKGKKKALTADQVRELKRHVADRESKGHVAKELGASRVTVYQYLR